MFEVQNSDGRISQGAETHTFQGQRIGHWAWESGVCRILSMAEARTGVLASSRPKLWSILKE